MSTTLRINEIAMRQGISIGMMEKSIGASKGVLSRALKNDTDIQSKWITLIIENYPQYNANWLLTGIGDMLLEEDDSMVNETPITYKRNSKKKTKPQDSKIPLIAISSIKNISLNNFKIKEEHIKNYYVIPKFDTKKVDFIIEITGNSMLPRYKSGDLVACTIIKDSTFIQWNRPHVIITKEQGVLIKRLKQSRLEEHLFAVSDNTQYDPFDLPISEIHGLALVVGGIFEE